MFGVGIFMYDDWVMKLVAACRPMCIPSIHVPMERIVYRSTII